MAGNGTKTGIGVRRSLYDYSLLFVVLFLCCFGLIMVYSASFYTARLQGYGETYYLRKQAFWYIGGAVAMVVISLIPYHFYAILAPVGYVVSLVVMVLINWTSLGKTVNGKARWLRIPGTDYTLQGADLVKIALILALAVVLTRMGKHADDMKNMIIVAALVGIPMILVLINNLSSGIVIAAIGLYMLFVCSRKKWPFLVILGVIALGVLVILLLGDTFVEKGWIPAYQMNRIHIWRDPEAYAQEGGYQVIQGLYAIGSGGLFGKGLGNGTQKLGFVPEASNDMIFSILCEELGLFGAFCLILLYLFLLYRMMLIANNAKDRFGSLLVVGTMIHIGLQVVLHIAVVTGVIPNTGVTLPFVSYGGSSVLFLMAEVGMVLGVAREIKV